MVFLENITSVSVFPLQLLLHSAKSFYEKGNFQFVYNGLVFIKFFSKPFSFWWYFQHENDDDVEVKSGKPTQRLNSPEDVQNI